MAKPDLEFMKEIFGDQRVHLTLAVVTKLEVVPSLAIARVQVSTLPEELEVIAQVSSQARLQDLPQPGDLGLIAYSDMEEAYWIATVSSADDPLSARAKGGDTVILARQSLYVTALTKVFIGLDGDSDPVSPLVLGDVLKSCFTDLITDLKAFLDQLKTGVDAIKTGLDAIKSGPVAIDSIGGSAVTHPTLITAMTTAEAAIATLETNIASYKSQLDSRKSTYVDTASSNIVSKIAFTERGS